MWLRGNWCKEQGKDLPWGTVEREAALAQGLIIGDPDSADHEKARALVEFAKWVRWARPLRDNDLKTSAELEVLFWIDWPCVDQSSPGDDMIALPAFVSACQLLVAYETVDYARRAWCRVELLLSYAFLTEGHLVIAINPNFEHTEQASMRYETRTLDDPTDGVLTNAADRTAVAELKACAVHGATFSWWRVFRRVWQGSWLECIVMNGLAVQFCGLWTLSQVRYARPGRSRVQWVYPTTPARGSLAASPRASFGTSEKTSLRDSAQDVTLIVHDDTDAAAASLRQRLCSSRALHVGGLLTACILLFSTVFLLPMRVGATGPVPPADAPRTTCASLLIWMGVFNSFTATGTFAFIDIGAPGLSIYIIALLWLVERAIAVFYTYAVTQRGALEMPEFLFAAYIAFIIAASADILHAWFPVTLGGTTMHAFHRFGPLVPAWQRFAAAVLSILHLAVLYGVWQLTGQLDVYMVTAQPDPSYQVLIWVAFQASFAACQPIQRSLARLIDRFGLASPKAHVEHLGTFALHAFYFSFYRALFDTIRADEVLVVATAMHIAAEVFFFIVCQMKSTIRAYHRMMMRGSGRRRVFYRYSGLGEEEAIANWRVYYSIDYGSRVVMMLLASVCRVLGTLLLTYNGYNVGGYRPPAHPIRNIMRIAYVVAAELVAHAIIIGVNWRCFRNPIGAAWPQFATTPSSWVWIFFAVVPLASTAYAAVGELTPPYCGGNMSIFAQ